LFDKIRLLLLPDVEGAVSRGKDIFPVPEPTNLNPPTADNVSPEDTKKASFPERNKDCANIDELQSKMLHSTIRFCFKNGIFISLY
jgi:hypothetical protein